MNEVYINEQPEPYVLEVDGTLDLAGLNLQPATIIINSKRSLVDSQTGKTKRRFADIQQGILQDGLAGSKSRPLQISGTPIGVGSQDVRSITQVSIWEALTKPFSDEVFADRTRSQTLPIGGGRTADNVGKWPLEAEVRDWLKREGIEEKLRIVPAKALGQHQPMSAHNNKIQHVEVLYTALHNSVYELVNAAAAHLGLELRYTQNRGDKGITKADLRAYHPQTQRTHIPHEVKGPWAEGHEGQHFADILQDSEVRHNVARPAAQLLYYMVEEGAVYGIVSSKRFHAFMRRPETPESRDIDFSVTFDSEQQTSPSVCLVYLYLLHLAQGSTWLQPHLRPDTAAELKWVTECNPKKRPRSSDQVVDSSNDGGGGDSSGDNGGGGDSSGDNGGASRPGTAHGNMEDSHVEDADANESDGTTGPDGPAAHTQSKAPSRQQSNVPMRRKPTSKHVSSSSQQSIYGYLQSLPIVTRPCLESSTVQIGRHCVVRQGFWQKQAAVYKLWDLGDSLDQVSYMRTEATMYRHLSALQGLHIPKLLTQGAFHRGLVAFIATSAGGPTLGDKEIQANPNLVQSMLLSLAAVHNQGVVHGDVALHNFVLAPDCTTVWLLDFESSYLGDASEQQLEMKRLKHIIKLAGVRFE